MTPRTEQLVAPLLPPEASPAPTSQAYRIVLDQGWYWASVAGSTPHLVPAYGDQARCGRRVTRAQRHSHFDPQQVPSDACRRCTSAVGIPTRGADHGRD